MRSEAEAIDQLVVTAGRAGLFFDFDGTLAPIQLDPAGVWPTPGVVEPLSALTSLVSRVAVVSARPVAFLRSRLGQVPDLALHGYYGLETMGPDGVVVTDPAALPWVPVLADLADRAERELPPAIGVERKPLAVSLHYRAAPQHRPLVDAWAEEQRRRSGVAAQPGRMVVELRPPVERDKGDVITEETADLAAAWYSGDDLSDLRAFRALTEREARSPGFVGVRAAVVNQETGREVEEAADFSIGPPEAVPRLLDRLVRALAG